MMPEKAELSEIVKADLRASVRLLRRRKGFISLVVLLALFSSVAYSLSVDEVWRAEVVVKAVGSEQAPISGALGGLAALAGIRPSSLSGSSNALVLLKSRDFARAFISKNNLSKDLVTDDPDEEPDLRIAIDAFQKNILKIRQDERSGLITVEIFWKSSSGAADMANRYVAELNESERARVLSESEKSIAYLRQQLASTDVLPVQKVLTALLEAETQKLVMAIANENYVVRTVDSAYPPRNRYAPKRTIIVLVAVFLSLIFAVTITFFENIFRRH